LFGKRIVITRSREQAAELVQHLERLGADPIVKPSIRIEPPERFDELDRAVASAGGFDWIIFTSANGVDHFMARLLAGPGDIRDLKGVRLCAIGPSTAGRLERYGLRVDLVPPEYRAEAVLEALQACTDLQGRRLLLPRADLARELLPQQLRAAGAEVTEVTAYRTVLAEQEGEPDVYRMLLDRKVDAIMFTSASTVRNFVKTIGPGPAADLLRTTVVACIGPVTAEAAQQFGIATTVMPSSYTIPALVDALVEHFRPSV
jgi:uroporphyrinogen III methyltransferase/synthase